MGSVAHDTDLAAWALETARALREGRVSEVDMDEVAEELEEMARSNRRELVSRLSVLLAHLMKWRHQPERRSRSWHATVTRQRQEVAALLAESPSLRSVLGTAFEEGYQRGVRLAASETGLPEESFPAGCPFPVDRALDPGFWPE
jgi:hypothetical protein